MSSRRAGAWPRSAAPVVRPASPDDREALVGLLAACSQETLHHRFLTGFGGTPRPSLVTRLLARDGFSRAVLAEADGVVVAHGMCAVAGPATVEVALLVRDDHQRRGIGSALVTALRGEAAAMAAHRVQLTTGADNRAVVAMVAARAPGLRPERDGTALTYHLPLDAASPWRPGGTAARLEVPAAPYGAEHGSTVTPTGPRHAAGPSVTWGRRPGNRLSASGRS